MDSTKSVALSLKQSQLSQQSRRVVQGRLSSPPYTGLFCTSGLRGTLQDQCPVDSASPRKVLGLSLIHISEPTRLGMISYAVFCLKKKKKKKEKKKKKKKQKKKNKIRQTKNKRQ